MFENSDLGKVVQYIGHSPGEINGELPIHQGKLFIIVNILDDGRIKVRDHIYDLDIGISESRLCTYSDKEFEFFDESKN